MARSVVIRHWLPIVTFCPVNHLPDLIYVSLEFLDNDLHELYAVRKQVRKAIFMKKMYMEDIADRISEEFPTANVTVRLAFDRHVVNVFPRMDF